MPNSILLRHAYALLGVLILCFVSIDSAQAGELRRLHGTVTSPDGVEEFQISPNGQRVVFLADLDTEGVFELYSASLGGSDLTKISGTMVSGGDIIDFSISPDSQTVVFRGDRAFNNLIELFSVPIAGGTVTRLSGIVATTSSADVGDFAISPNGEFVAFSANKTVGSRIDLYTVEIGGGAVTRINGDMITGGDVVEFAIIATGSNRVFFRADKETNDQVEFYSVMPNGTFLFKLNGDLPAGGNVTDFKLMPSESSAIFRADQNEDNVFELYSVASFGGSTLENISGFLVDGGDVKEFAISSDGEYVVFIADKTSNNRDDLYSVSLTSGSIYRLNGVPVAGSDVNSFLIRPNGQRVVFLSDKETDGVRELFSAPIVNILGSDPTIKISGDLVTDGNVQGNYSISADGDNVLFRADKDSDGVLELYSTRIASGNPIKLSGELVAGGNVSSSGYSYSPNSNQVAFSSDKNVDGFYQLFGVSRDGGTITTLSDPLVVDGGVLSDFEFSANGQYLVFRANADSTGSSLYVYDFDDDLCMPIKTSNGNMAVICL